MMYIICNLKYDQISHGLRQLKLAELCFKQPSLMGALTCFKRVDCHGADSRARTAHCAQKGSSSQRLWTCNAIEDSPLRQRTCPVFLGGCPFVT